MSSSTVDVVAAPPDRSKARLARWLFGVTIGSTVIGLGHSLMAWRASDESVTGAGP